MNNISTGKIGELHAENFLISHDYKIIAKNFHTRFGEIDIIAIDDSNSHNQLVFVEVKTRTSDVFGLPQESIDYRKRAKMLKTAIHFMNSSTENLPHIWRMDAIAVKLTKSMKIIDLKHFKNILDGN
ncbi:MAG: YraN family protein [Candidatus Peregrinibacteria bacterium]|nr:YraN family protein [Candidatus Peregrinibacteria bacterium]